jgi:UDP-glucose 6-dehydrogenase
MYKIGIIGNGFVGSAIAGGFALHADVCVYDVDPKRTINTFEEVMACEFVFVCVPTPMNVNNNNKIDLSIIKNVFEEIEKQENRDSVFILKSTVIPGTTNLLSAEYPNLNIVFNPEFLTERTARLDFINTSRIVLGGKPELCQRVKSLYRDRFQHTKIICTDATSAEFTKYMCNSFFSTKISFLNEMRQATDKLGLDWNNIVEGFLSDGRIGNSHTDVPGHDGNYGFGGKCFPKDLNAFINFFNDIQITPTVLTAAWEKNLEVRKELDWEKIEGATSTQPDNAMDTITADLKNRTIAIDFDGVIHRYSRKWQGMNNAYDPPMPGAIDSIKELKRKGYRLVIFSSRTVSVIKEWLEKYELTEYFDEVTNTKIPASVYIDDKCYHFDSWEQTIKDILSEEK